MATTRRSRYTARFPFVCAGDSIAARRESTDAHPPPTHSCDFLSLSAVALAGPLEDGRAKLFARDFAGAEADFTLAIATPPVDDDEAAHAFRSAARIGRFLDDEGAGDPGEIDSLKELLELFAFPADQRSVLDGSIIRRATPSIGSTCRRIRRAEPRCRASSPVRCSR